MKAQPLALGIDFGTSNSAVAHMATGGEARLLPLEGDAGTLPTAVFFNAEDRSTHVGRDAIGLYLAGVEGRLMRSLKSLLGSSLLQEQTEIDHRRVSFEDIIALFLGELAERSRQRLGRDATRLVMGRPVHFVDDDPARDRMAEDSLRRAAVNAGLPEPEFQFEPIAAAFDFERRITRETLVLVVDIGGGTSDFTVVRLGPDRPLGSSRTQDVLATRGVHLGGTDFDQRLSLDRVMPLLGLGHAGRGGREVPSRIFFDLSYWHLIHWLYAPKSMRAAQELRTSYLDIRLHDRLMRVLAERLGHRLASEVERAKISVASEGDDATMDLEEVEAGLRARLSPGELAADLSGLLQRVVDCARDCVRAASLHGESLGAIYLTGGSSALPPFQAALREAFAGVPLVEGDLFGGVACGLARVAAARPRPALR